MEVFVKKPREFTNIANFILDNILPPILRNQKWFMTPMMKAVLGPKYKYYMEFKNNLYVMNDDDIENYYHLLADTNIERDTDINVKCLSFIVNNLIGDSVIDVGCGRGYLLKQIEKMKIMKMIIGFDLIPPSDDNRGNIFYQQGEMTKLPYGDNSFDTVICAHTLEHIRDINTALNEIKRITNKRLIIVLPRQREYLYTFDLHIHFFPYMYNVKSFVKEQNANYYTIQGDFVCIIDM
jgi:ubiquinone/menaquinone biosynthesis C-methylase UbiE